MEASPAIYLKTATSKDWAPYCVQHISSFLIDHAACERKASATAIHFVVRYPDRPILHQTMIRVAQEELLHFREVMKIVEDRGLTIGADEKNTYVNSLLKMERHGRSEGFLDRLLIVGIVEARGCERFQLFGEALATFTPDDITLINFYRRLAKAEAKHHQIFVNAALRFFEKTVVEERLEELLQVEAHIIQSLPLRAAVH